MWIGLTLSYVIPKLPPSTAIIAVASGIYLIALLLTAERGPLTAWPRPSRARPTEN